MLLRIIIPMFLSFLVLCGAAEAIEYPIGEPQYRHGMKIGAVYLQPVVMEPEGMMLSAERADVHLEMDIVASEGNGNGFEAGNWIPYLVARYQLKKVDSDWEQKGDLMPMVASDGPHYGDNVKLNGPGRYQLIFYVLPPSHNKNNHFGRHTDRLTGVRPWFKPFEVEYAFVFAGLGKIGGY